MREYMTATMMRQDLFCRGPRARAARVACVHAPAMNQSQHGVCCVGVCEVRAAGASTPPRTGSTRHRTARARRGGRYRHINCRPAPTGGRRAPHGPGYIILILFPSSARILN